MVFADQVTQGVVKSGPLMALLPAPEDPIDRLPGGKILGQIPPGDAAFDHIEDRVEHLAQVGAGPSPVRGFRQHRFEIFPLGVGEAGFVFGVFHRLNGSCRLK